MNGIDLFRIEDGLIQEVWLFSAEQAIEDDLWKWPQCGGIEGDAAVLSE